MPTHELEPIRKWPRMSVPITRPEKTAMQTTRAGWRGQGSALECTTPFAAAHIHRSEAGYRLGSDRGSPNHGSTLFSKRVMAEIRSPLSVSM